MPRCFDAVTGAATRKPVRQDLGVYDVAVEGGRITTRFERRAAAVSGDAATEAARP